LSSDHGRAFCDG
jgi:hypothetical protein